MSKKKHDKPLRLDMSFEEALNRFVQSDPRAIEDLKKPKTKKKAAHSLSVNLRSAEDRKPS